MTSSYADNGQIPTDPTIFLVLLLAVITAGQLAPDQAEALTGAGHIAELALTLLVLSPERR